MSPHLATLDGLGHLGPEHSMREAGRSPRVTMQPTKAPARNTIKATNVAGQRFAKCSGISVTIEAQDSGGLRALAEINQVMTARE